MQTSLCLDRLEQLLSGRLSRPEGLLGVQQARWRGRTVGVIRTFLPQGRQVWLEGEPVPGGRMPMRRVHPAGVFEAVVPEVPQRATQYRFRVVQHNGQQTEMYDPYAFPPLLTDYDRHLLAEGTHWQSYRKLGAQLRSVDGVAGVNFAVWAPNATAVSVIGDFNDWDPRRHVMRKHEPGGFWELFIPGLKPGALYKYAVRYGEELFEKADPYAFASEVPPRTASVVADLDQYQWHDAAWMASRNKRQAHDQPISIYEVHLGSWKRDPSRPGGWMNYRQLAHELVRYCQQMGYTHLELLPVAEHPLSASWGYQVTGYYAPTARYGSPQDFMYFVDYCHQHGIGVIVDWVPSHFPKDAHGLARFDGTHLYEHADPRQGEHPDWGTLCFNYGRYEVSNFLISNALFWLDRYHVDGLRVDAVASMLYLDYSRGEGQWVPNRYGGRENLEAIEFLKRFNQIVHLQFPGVLTIAEESTAWPAVSRPTYVGGLGFSLKWNMGWMNDTLRYMAHDPIHRKYHHDELTFSLIYAFHENFVLPLSHDEVVHGKGSLLGRMPGDLWQKFANLRLLLAYMWTHPGKKLLFMGGDFGQWHEWNYDAALQWDLLAWDTHRGVMKLVEDLNRLLKQQPALHQRDFQPEGFQWIDCHSYQESTLAYLRRANDPDDFLLVALNFTPVPRMKHRLGVPRGGWYQEIFNSDSQYYGGSNLGNFPGVMAQEIPCHGQPYSVEITLPPLAAVIFKPQRDTSG